MNSWKEKNPSKADEHKYDLWLRKCLSHSGLGAGEVHRRIVPYVPCFSHFCISTASPCQSYACGQNGSVSLGPGWCLQQPLGRVGRPRYAHVAAVLPACIGKPTAIAVYSCLCDWTGVCTRGSVGVAHVTPLTCLLFLKGSDSSWKGRMSLPAEQEPLKSELRAVGADAAPACGRERLEGASEAWPHVEVSMQTLLSSRARLYLGLCLHHCCERLFQIP